MSEAATIENQTGVPASHRQPYRSYTDSGVEWLGRLPDHWQASRLKRHFAVVNGATPHSSEESYWDGEIPWATPDDLGALTGDTIHRTERMLTTAGYESCGTTLVPAGSLILSTRAPVGHLAIAGVPLCTNQGCRALVPRHSVSIQFFYYKLMAARLELQSWAQGSTFAELGK